MVINTTTANRYTVSGSSYTISFPYWKEEEIKAVVTLSDGSLQDLVLNTDYSVSTPNGNNGTLTKLTAWTDANKLTIYRASAKTQEVDLVQGQKINADTIENAFDHAIAINQELQEKLSRSITTSIDEAGSDISIPNKASRAGMLLGFDNSGENAALRSLAQFDADVANTATNAGIASAAASNALASENKAYKWAEEAEDVPVEPSKYSAKHWATKAIASATKSESKALDSEAFAIGKRNGQDVPSTDPAYHNNSKYYLDIVKQTISGALRYQGVWTTTGATDYSGISLPRLKGDMFYCQGSACTIGGVTYSQGDYIIFNQDVASGTITTAMIDKIDNTETVTPDNLIILTSKTIDSKDNKIRNTAKELPTGTTINADGDTSYTFNANNAVVTLGTAPYIGCRVTVVTWGYYGYVLYKFGSSWKCIYVSAGQRLDFTNTGTGLWRLNDGQCLLVPNTDAITLAPNNPDTSTQMCPNDWREDYGCNEFTVGYAAGSIIISNYATPDDRCIVKVMGAYTRRVAQAYKWQITGSRTPIWTNKKHDNTWDGWTTFTGGGSGTVHTIAAADIGSGFSGSSIKWVVQNGMCILSCWVLKGTTIGNNQTVATNLPKAKISSGQSCVKNGENTVASFVFISANATTLQAHVFATVDSIGTIVYPVADDWVES